MLYLENDITDGLMDQAKKKNMLQLLLDRDEEWGIDPPPTKKGKSDWKKLEQAIYVYEGGGTSSATFYGGEN